MNVSENIQKRRIIYYSILRAWAHNEGYCETRDNSRRTDRASASSRLCLSYVSTASMPHLRLDYALASISCEHTIM